MITRLLSLAKKGDITTMIVKAEAFDDGNIPASMASEFYSILILGYLTKGNDRTARSTYKRIPTEIKTCDKNVCVVWGVAECLCMHPPDLKTAHAMLKQWNAPPQFVDLVSGLLQAIEKRTQRMLGAYCEGGTVPVEEVTKALHMSDSERSQMASSPNGQNVYVNPLPYRGLSGHLAKLRDALEEAAVVLPPPAFKPNSSPPMEARQVRVRSQDTRKALMEENLRLLDVLTPVMSDYGNSDIEYLEERCLGQGVGIDFCEFHISFPGSGGHVHWPNDDLPSVISDVQTLAFTKGASHAENLPSLLSLLSKANRLEELFLEGSSVTDENVTSVVAAVMRSKMLRIISLRNNPLVGHSAGIALYRLACGVPTLTQIHLDGTSVWESQKAKIHWQLEHNLSSSM